MYRKKGYIIARIVGFLAILVMAFVVAIQTPYFQTRLSKLALNQLAATGLVVATPKCGMRVRSFSFEDMKNVLEARLMIEQFSAISRANIP